MIAIPNTDIYIARGGIDEIYQLPDRVPPLYNDWLDQDGLEVDLSTPVWQAWERPLTLHVLPERISSLSDELTRDPSIFLQAHSSLPSLPLRYISCDSYRHRGGLALKPTKMATLTLRVALDDPRMLFEGITTSATRHKYGETHIALDGADLCKLGIIVHGAYSSLLSPHSTKERITYTSSYRSERIVPPRPTLYAKARRIAIDLSIVGETRLQQMSSYAALWEILSAPGARELATVQGSIQCYYTSSSPVTWRKGRLSFTLNFQEI